MDFLQLLYFKKVAEAGGVTRAAEGLMLTQPALSKSIKALEDEIGERLFDRIGKKVFLTNAGKVLYSHADKILNSLDEARNALKALSGECSGELVIGTSDHISIHRLPGIVKAFMTACPKVDLQLRCHRSETILAMVEQNQVDLGVITLPKTGKSLLSTVIWKDEMHVICPRKHPLGLLKSVHIRDLIPYPLILPEAGTTTRREIDAAFGRRELIPVVAMEVAYLETIKGLVKAGLGISILPETAVAQEIKSGWLIKRDLEDVTFSRNLGVVYLKDKYLSRQAKEFLRLLEAARDRNF